MAALHPERGHLFCTGALMLPVRELLPEGGMEIFLHDRFIYRFGILLQLAQVIEILQNRVTIPESAAPENAFHVALFVRNGKGNLQFLL